MNEPIYSLRMRAAVGGAHEQGGRHVSGAERLVGGEDIADASAELIRRAREHSGGEDADFIQVSIERLPPGEIERMPCLPLTLSSARTVEEARRSATRILMEAGVYEAAIERAFDGLDHGLGVGGSAANWGNDAQSRGSALHGAALFDWRTGERYDSGRGVRASRFDYEPKSVRSVDVTLEKLGLTHYRTREALALATKVIWSGVTAELCWSDEPDYVAGYVATKSHGYVRFVEFKPAGAVGGRAFFVDPYAVPVDSVIDRLRWRALWITGPLTVI
jgi:6-carboxyhexanoate--CoA ligase